MTEQEILNSLVKYIQDYKNGAKEIEFKNNVLDMITTVLKDKELLKKIVEYVFMCFEESNNDNTWNIIDFIKMYFTTQKYIPIDNEQILIQSDKDGSPSIDLSLLDGTKYTISVKQRI